MREMSDEQIEAMTAAQKSEYARRRAVAKYHHPHLEHEGEGGDWRTLFQGVAVAAAVVLVAGAGWAWHRQTTAEPDRPPERVEGANPSLNAGQPPKR